MQQGQQLSTAHHFPSVTSVLGILDKPALIPWAANEAAACAVDHIAMLRNRVEKEGKEPVAAWIAEARFRPKKGRRTATALGTVCHDLFEQHLLYGGAQISQDDEAWPFYARFAEWCEKEQPKAEASECTVVGKPFFSSHRDQSWMPCDYAGTLDGIIEWNGRRILIDFKTTREPYQKDGKPSGPYPEAVLQLAAYRYADLLIPTRVRTSTQFSRRSYEITDFELQTAEPMPQVDAVYVMHITPVSCRAYPINADEGAFEAFLHLRAAYEPWLNMRERIGRPE